MKKLACVDDSQDNLECMKLMLGSAFDVHTYSDPDEFLNCFLTTNYNAILLDVNMPAISGFSLYEKIIEQPKYNGCPIFFISSDDTEVNRIQALTLGAVDFLHRDLTPEEMLLRIQSKILYFEKHPTVLELRELKLNLIQLNATLMNHSFKLTFTEFKLLYNLLKEYPQILTKEEVIERVWGKTSVSEATIYTHVFNLNSKLKLWSHEIVIERLKGIKLVIKEGEL